MVELIAHALAVKSDDGATLVHPLDLQLESGGLIALIGPNGAGKSSLMRGLAGVIAHHGTAQVDGQDIAAMTAVHRARRIAWLPQALPPAWPVSVHEAVALGRFAYGATPGRLAEADARAVDTALAACDVTSLRQRRITTLSGGELARVHLARALAADTPVLLADEPTAALDLAHRWTLMALLAGQAREGRLVLVVVHDLGLAARWADRVLVLDRGRLVADGPPARVMTPAMLGDVFGITAAVTMQDGRPVIDVSGVAAAATG